MNWSGFLSLEWLFMSIVQFKMNSDLSIWVSHPSSKLTLEVLFFLESLWIFLLFYLLKVYTNSFAWLGVTYGFWRNLSTIPAIAWSLYRWHCGSNIVLLEGLNPWSARIGTLLDSEFFWVLFVGGCDPKGMHHGWDAQCFCWSCLDIKSH